MTHGKRKVRGARGTCVSGKVRYRDSIAARLALATIVARASTRHTERRAYRCAECAGWHLTSLEEWADR